MFMGWYGEGCDSQCLAYTQHWLSASHYHSALSLMLPIALTGLSTLQTPALSVSTYECTLSRTVPDRLRADTPTGYELMGIAEDG
ncbi:hypothetical protein GCM10027080_05680 [Pedococcus soli]